MHTSGSHSRRGFFARLGTPAAAAIALPWLSATAGRTVEAFARPGPARLRLSLAAYSFRQFFKHQRDGGQPARADKAIDLFDFVDFCAEHGCDGAELTGYYFPADCDADYLARLKRHAHLRGVAVSGSAVGNTFTLPVGEKRSAEIAQVKLWIERTAALGGAHLRIFAGDVPNGVTRGQARALCISAVEECCAHAAKHGVLLGLENHGGIVAEPADLLDLVRTIKTPWLGINLDSGNFHTEDPYADFARCLPYAVNVQLKVELQARGKPKGAADLGRLVKSMREARYQGYVALEYEAAEDPWVAVPRHLQTLRTMLAS